MHSDSADVDHFAAVPLELDFATVPLDLNQGPGPRAVQYEQHYYTCTCTSLMPVHFSLWGVDLRSDCADLDHSAAVPQGVVSIGGPGPFSTGLVEGRGSTSP